MSERGRIYCLAYSTALMMPADICAPLPIDYYYSSFYIKERLFRRQKVFDEEDDPAGSFFSYIDPSRLKTRRMSWYIT